MRRPLPRGRLPVRGRGPFGKTDAAVCPPRRAFALVCLRNGVDLISLQRLLGHSDLSVTRRCLAQTEADLQQAHQEGGPVDRLP